MTKNRYWALIIVFLIAVIITGGIIAGQRYRQPPPIEISLPPSQGFQGEIYLGGAVSNPGFYPLKSGDSIYTLIQAAGGITDNADLTNLRIYVPRVGEEETPQKIDINRAEAWLLEALPSIGESRAQAIIDYRQTNGGFRNIIEITKVEDIGPSTYEEIKDLITVAD
jgi:competence protein ComEA